MSPAVNRLQKPFHHFAKGVAFLLRQPTDMPAADTPLNLRRRPRVNNPNMILAAVGVREKQDALFGGRADRDKPPHSP